MSVKANAKPTVLNMWNSSRWGCKYCRVMLLAPRSENVDQDHKILGAAQEIMARHRQ
jgi:hypothetical protein